MLAPSTDGMAETPARGRVLPRVAIRLGILALIAIRPGALLLIAIRAGVRALIGVLTPVVVMALAAIRLRAWALIAISVSARQAIRAMPPIIRAEGAIGTSREPRRLGVLSAAKRHPRICCCMRSNRP